MPDPYRVSDEHFAKVTKALAYIMKQDGVGGDINMFPHYLQEYGNLVSESPENDATLDGFNAQARYDELAAEREEHEDTLQPTLEVEYQALKTALGI